MTNNADDYPDSQEYAHNVEEWIHNYADTSILRLCQTTSTSFVPASLCDPIQTAPDMWLEYVGNDMTDDDHAALMEHLTEIVSDVYQSRTEYLEEACGWAHAANVAEADDAMQERFDRARQDPR